MNRPGSHRGFRLYICDLNDLENPKLYVVIATILNKVRHHCLFAYLNEYQMMSSFTKCG